jgi:hypothetical protein
MFFDRTGPSPISDLLHFNGEVLKRFLVNSPSYPITEPELAGVPTSVVVLDPRQRIPDTLQYSVGVEQQLNVRSTLFANVGARGIGMFRSIDANAPPPPDYIATGRTAGIGSSSNLLICHQVRAEARVDAGLCRV